MRKTTLTLFILVLLAPLCLKASNTINLTPVPKQIAMKQGTLTLPETFAINTNGLPEEMVSEVRKFAKAITTVRAGEINIGDNIEDALITVSPYSGNTNIGDEGYRLDITTTGITLSANTAQGLYYGFQTIKKLLPPCVMAQVSDSSVTEYTLPCLSIVDAPRFEYRGFMLDVARHYFEVDEIKRMLDVMSYYKMNRFHWHLVDDQGWRIQIDKYPKLTTIGATRSNSWSVDPIYGGYYTNEPYGPYFYTKEEAREIVEYAKERHIEVIPEIEFPGHACAALAAYPEFSCTPTGSHSVKVDGGIYNDVFNVGSPATLQFAKDVLDEIIEIFPYSQVHIGGDECPTTAWSSNKECNDLMKAEGFSNIRELQSRFVRLLADHLREKGKESIMWNESLSAGGTNVELIKGTNGTMMCWEQGKVQSTALQAAQLGMNSIITPWGPYYINRKQSTNPGEPVGAGGGADDLRATYNYVPVPSDVPTALQKYYVGVQGTFWTEHVQSNYLLEYLALPRLIAIAETGWSPASKKNFDDFCRRVTADSVLLNYNNYEYGRHFMTSGSSSGDDKVMPKASTESDWHWHHIVTGATDATRAGKCIELLREGAPQIGTGNARAGRLWNGTIANEGEAAYDYQLWALMEDPSNPGKYALVCKAKPEGSVNSTPTANNNTARWDYDESKRHYDFILGKAVYSKNGNYYRYSIHSQKAAEGMYMNFAGAGQNNSINMWSDPNDGNGGVWEFQPIGSEAEVPQINYPQKGAFVRISNNVPTFAGWRMVDDGSSNVKISEQQFCADVWEITVANTTSDGQSVALRNLATGRFINSTSAPVTLGGTAVQLKNVYNERTGDFSIMAGNGAIFPMPERAVTNPLTLNVGGIYPQGSAWVYEPVYQVTYECYDNEGNLIGKYYHSAAQNEPYECSAPEIKNMRVKSIDTTSFAQLDGHKNVKVTYERTAYAVTVRHIESNGGIILVEEHSAPLGELFSLPESTLPAYYTIADEELPNDITLTADTIITLTYSTDAYLGFRAVGDAVTKVENGKSYLFFNNKNDSSRNGFLNASVIGGNILTDNSAASGSPAYVWYLEKSGNYSKVVNGLGCYIPALTKGSANHASKSGGDFTFTANSNGTFSVKCSNGLYWNANSDHTFTGWSDAHPFIAYEYYVQPYFSVNITCIDSEGNILQESSTIMIADESFTISLPTIEGYVFQKIEGANEGVNIADGHKDIKIIYTSATGIVDVKQEDATTESGTFDLQGRKVTHPVKGGIYISNGKKIIITK